MTPTSPFAPARQWLWLPIWTAAALGAIFATGPVPLFSTRSLSVAWEMWQHGQFLVPMINGAPYSHKTPLLFWLIQAGWAVGGVGEVWPRLLEVACGATVLLLAQRLARVLFPDSPRTALMTPWILGALSYVFLFSLQIMYEVLLAVWVLSALCALAGRGSERKPAFVLLALSVGLGLLSKGPVMLLHVIFPFLLGPWWQPWAARNRARWYRHGGLALLGGFAVLLAWALPAGFAGGEAYRNQLFFMQTAGRVVDSFDHARPLWWYLGVLPVLALPWLLWPRTWRALVTVAGERSAGLRALVAWLVPTLLAFSLISGKQAYYPLPECAGGALLLARGLALLSERSTPLRAFERPWPLVLAGLTAAALLLWLPQGVASGAVTSAWYVDLAGASPWFAAAFALLAIGVAWAPRIEAVAVMLIGTASLFGVALAYMIFAQTLYLRFDLLPAAREIARLQAAGIPIANEGTYEGQFHFLGRLSQPIPAVEPDTLESWAHAHPEGRVVRYPRDLSAADMAAAQFVQPFRSGWLVIERAGGYVARENGAPVAPNPAGAVLYPPGYWRYATAH